VSPTGMGPARLPGKTIRRRNGPEPDSGAGRFVEVAREGGADESRAQASPKKEARERKVPSSAFGGRGRPAHANAASKFERRLALRGAVAAES